MSESLNLRGRWPSWAFNPVTVKSGTLKDMGSPFKAIAAGERAIMQSIIEEVFCPIYRRGSGKSEGLAEEAKHGLSELW